MLILSRKINESIVIDGQIVVKIVRIDGDQVKLGIQAPSQVPVHRHEVYAEIQKNNQEALDRSQARLPRLQITAVTAEAGKSSTNNTSVKNPSSPHP